MEIKTVKKIAITIHGEGGYKLHLLIYSILYVYVVVQNKNFAASKNPKL